jgi:hypothetical protein
MTGDSRSSGAGGSPWGALARRQRGHPLLDLDPLYALPEALFNSLVASVPGLFRSEDVAFERDLARTASGGFFHHRPFDCLLLAGRTDPGRQRLEAEIREGLSQELQDVGLHAVQAGRHLAAEDRQDEQVELRLAAYTGWLITRPQFRAERDALQLAHGGRVQQLGHFPALPRSFFGERPEPPDAADLPLLRFCRRWGLETMLTWQLPLPLRPELAGFTTYDSSTLGEAGLNLFVPWHLLRDGWLHLADLARRQRAARAVEHLAGWLSVREGRHARLGYKRLRTQLAVYRYRELALSARYADRLLGHAEKVDRALARFLGTGAESVKKLRLDLLQRLAEPADHPPRE